MKFTELGLSEKTIQSLSKLGYDEPTEVQVKAIPEILEGKNLIVRSQTGTGKTAAFGIGLIERIDKKETEKALILTPTRELAMQVCKEIRSIADNRLRIHTAYGGQSINIQIQNLKGGVDILVATPGRLLDLYRRRIVDISEFDGIVLDEADHMLDLGFQDEVLAVLKELTRIKLMLLISATIDESIMRIASKYIPEAKTIEIGEIEVAGTIKEEHIETTSRERFRTLLSIIKKNPDVKTLIFVETKMGASRVQEKLSRCGIRNVGLLQGDLSQSRRNAVINGFKEDTIRIMVATNVAARGIHVENLDLIVNYDKAQDEETHLHRVGRTGRMGAEGKVINFIPRKETMNERMDSEHPDFAWMKDGMEVYKRDSAPKKKFSRDTRKRGPRSRGPGYSKRAPRR